MLLNPGDLLREECPVHTSHWVELTPICHLGAEQGSSSSYYLLLHNSHLSSQLLWPGIKEQHSWFWLRVLLEAASHMKAQLGPGLCS